MPRFTTEQAAAIAEMQQLVNEWGYELDINDCRQVSRLCTEDCAYFVGGTEHRGHAAIDAFYAARGERVRTQQRDGTRTQRHSISNFRFTFDGEDAAEATFGLVNYSGEGKAPILNLIGPTIVADCRMEFRRQNEGVGTGEWKIALFDSMPVFIGNDPFLNASVVKK